MLILFWMKIGRFRCSEHSSEREGMLSLALTKRAWGRQRSIWSWGMFNYFPFFLEARISRGQRRQIQTRNALLAEIKQVFSVIYAFWNRKRDSPSHTASLVGPLVGCLTRRGTPIISVKLTKRINLHEFYDTKWQWMLPFLPFPRRIQYLVSLPFSTSELQRTSEKRSTNYCNNLKSRASFVVDMQVYAQQSSNPPLPLKFTRIYHKMALFPCVWFLCIVTLAFPFKDASRSWYSPQRMHLPEMMKSHHFTLSHTCAQWKSNSQLLATSDHRTNVHITLHCITVQFCVQYFWGVAVNSMTQPNSVQ